MNFIYRFLVIFLSLVFVNILYSLYLLIFDIDRDLGFIGGLTFSIFYSFLECIFITLLCFVFFNLIYKIKIKNKNLFFLILCVSIIFIILWEISYTGGISNIVFEYDIIVSGIFYLFAIFIYGYYLKYIKKVK